MREIGTIADEESARVLGDYLLTLGISTRLAAEGDGTHVWVHREDKLDEARAVLAAFREAPDDPRYQAAARDARAIRKEEEREEAEYRSKVRRMSDRWDAPFHRRAPLCATLLAISVAVTLATNFGGNDSRLLDLVTFSDRTVVLVNGIPQVRDSGFAEIARGQVWRLITPIFLHLSPIHLLFNMAWLAVLGGGIEARKGWKKVAIMALAAAVLGDVAQYYEAGGGFGGMSGVVYAFLGYVWAKGHSDPEDGFSLSANTAVLMVAWFLFGVLSKPEFAVDQAVPRLAMANAAHGVGLAVGLVFGLLRY